MEQALETLEWCEPDYDENPTGFKKWAAVMPILREALEREHAMHDLARLGQEIEQEPTPWRDMVVVSLVREGIDKHRARELADHFAAQPEQEPVAWTTMPKAADWDFISGSKDPTNKLEGKWVPLYAAPPQRTWVGLTKVQRDDFADAYGSYEAVCAIEQRLKELNT